MRQFATVASVLLVASGAARGQDSVPTASGGNDALSAYEPISQRVRYVVDGVPIQTSWGNQVLVAPLLKASRESDPLFRTQILGSVAVSPTLATGVTGPALPYSLWTATPGAGVHPTFNSAPGSVSVGAFSSRFGLAASDFSLLPSNVIGAIVGRDSANGSRFYVERVAAVQSRFGQGGPDTASVSLGAVDSAGRVFLRADAFGTAPATATRVVGENIVRVDLAARNGAMNNLTASGAVNTATDAAATAYIVNNEAAPTNTPTGLLSGSNANALVFDFAGRLRTGAGVGAPINLGAAHLAAGVTGHRGNPAWSPLNAAGGTAGTVASLAMRTGATRADALNAFGLNAGATPSVAIGTPRAFQLPAPIAGPNGFFGNTSGLASFRQYLSQTPFRGGNGQVGVGANASGQLVLAATANDPTQGDFVAVVAATGPSTSAWSVAAHPGMPVLDGAGGSAIGSLGTPTTISAPAVDRLGNVYFVATWQPSLAPAGAGLFKAVNTPTGYRLERLLATGQQIAGANSGRTYTVSQLILSDLDSIASGAFHTQQLIQDQLPGAATADPASIHAAGGLVMNAVITYDNGGQPEAYDTVLFIGPAAPATPPCRADFNGSGAVDVADIFAFLSAWFSNAPGSDFNGSGAVDVADIFAFLSAWFAGC